MCFGSLRRWGVEGDLRSHVGLGRCSAKTAYSSRIRWKTNKKVQKLTVVYLWTWLENGRKNDEKSRVFHILIAGRGGHDGAYPALGP